MKKIILFCIRFYQKYLSLDQGLPHKFFPNTRICIFEPTCSEYAYQSVSKYGIIRGVLLGMRRILRCGPWSDGGFDPVP